VILLYLLEKGHDISGVITPLMWSFKMRFLLKPMK